MSDCVRDNCIKAMASVGVLSVFKHMHTHTHARINAHTDARTHMYNSYTLDFLRLLRSRIVGRTEVTLRSP